MPVTADELISNLMQLKAKALLEHGATPSFVIGKFVALAKDDDKRIQLGATKELKDILGLDAPKREEINHDITGNVMSAVAKAMAERHQDDE